MGILADTHLMPEDRESRCCFPGLLDALSPVAAERVYREHAAAAVDAFNAAMQVLHAVPPTVIVHLGDVTSGWQERGTCHASVHDLARDAVRALRNIAPVFVAAGNHDTGYSDARSELGGALTREGIDACAEAFGALWWAFERDTVLFVGICSPLAAYPGNDVHLLRLRTMQEDFLGDTLAADTHRPWVLFAHETKCLRSVRLRRILAPHLRRCRRIVQGDLHNLRAGRMLTLSRHLSPRTGLRERQALRRTTLCPSVAPFWSRGYRLMQGSIRNGAFRTILLRCPERRTFSLPTRSVMRSLLYTKHVPLFGGRHIFRER